jgi:hypothetical protein
MILFLYTLKNMVAAKNLYLASGFCYQQFMNYSRLE